MEEWTDGPERRSLLELLQGWEVRTYGVDRVLTMTVDSTVLCACFDCLRRVHWVVSIDSWMDGRVALSCSTTFGGA